MLKRVESGIVGLDPLIQGGFPESSVICLLGEAGTGKTIFGMQFLFYGAKNGERGLYITGAEPIQSLKKFMTPFKFYNGKNVENGTIKLWDLAGIMTEFPEKGLGSISTMVKETNPRRVVIDPLPPPYLFDNVIEYRRFLYKLFATLKTFDTLTLVISEKVGSQVDAEYLADGVIDLSLKPVEKPLEYRNLLQIKKMRGTSHTREVLALDISEDGLAVVKIGRVV
ncbi:MAG: ATPase domain-containing protein [Candidatus Thermoplasmatota archaeon]